MRPKLPPVWALPQSMSLDSPSPIRAGRSGRSQQWDVPWESEQGEQCLYFQEGSKVIGQYHPWGKRTAKLDTHKRMCRPLHISNNLVRQPEYKTLYYSGGKWIHANYFCSLSYIFHPVKIKLLKINMNSWVILHHNGINQLYLKN